MKKITLVWQIVIGLALGIVVGWYFNTHPEYQQWVSHEIFKPLGDIFIKMMKMVVVPIVFCCMILGITGSGDNRSFGRMGVKALGYFFTVTGVAIVFGLVLANLISPGEGTSIQGMAHGDRHMKMGAGARRPGYSAGILCLITCLLPFRGANSCQFCSLPCCSAWHSNGLPRNQNGTYLGVLQSVSDGMFRVVSIVMAYAPVGVFGMIGATVSTFGFASLLPLLRPVAPALSGADFICRDGAGRDLCADRRKRF